jgi:hypothetical protein
MFQKMTICTSRKKGFVCPYDCPAYGGGRIAYRVDDCPNVELVLRTSVIVQMNEFYGRRDIVETAQANRKMAEAFAVRRRT